MDGACGKDDEDEELPIPDVVADDDGSCQVVRPTRGSVVQFVS